MDVERPRFWLMIVLALGALAYANTLANGFVGDDFLVIVNNFMIRSWQNLPRLISHQYLTADKDLLYEGLRDIGSGELSYRPVVTLSYFVDRHVWGAWAGGYHLTSLLLHLAAVVFLFRVVVKLTGDASKGALAALVFALHPVNTEAVSVISYREDVLAGLFTLASFDAYLGYRKRGSRWRLTLSLVCFVLGVFSKESAVMLPLILWVHGRIMDRAAGPRAGLAHALVAVPVVAVWLYYSNGPFGMVITPHAPVLTRVATMLKVFGVYLYWIGLPVGIHLCATEPTFAVAMGWRWEVLLPAAALALLVVSLLRGGRKLPAVTFGAVWVLIFLLPVSGIFPIYNILAARFLYLPMIGVSLAAGSGLPAFWRAVSRRWPGLGYARLAAYTVGTLTVFYLTFTAIRNMTFMNNHVFWAESARFAPNNGSVRLVIANDLCKLGEYDRAIEEYRMALRLGTEQAWAFHGLGISHYMKGDFEKAVKALKECVRRNDADMEARQRLGSALGELGRYSEAVSQFRQVLEAEPQNLMAMHNLAVTYARMGRFEQAREQWQKALLTHPGERAIRMNLAALNSGATDRLLTFRRKEV